jgi:cellulose biosynthesis protein BcsQ
VSQPARGEVITFYSYKGGTGRSMALANVSSLLARGGKRVLAVDWDLESPGLHRFFEPYAGAVMKSDGWAASTPGLIELVEEVFEIARSRYGEEGFLGEVDLARYCFPTGIERLWLLKAGRLDSDYPQRVAKIDWEERYKQYPDLFQAFSERLAADFDYVLIDSRTGVTDISGICTALMPEKVVLVFTPTAQSIDGGIEVMYRSASFRRQSNDLRPMVIYPLPSRIEWSERELRSAWSFRYQERFESLFRRIYDLPDLDLTQYFSEVQIQQVPRYAYGEEIAVLTEESNRLSISRSYSVFTNWLTAMTPWETVNEDG